MNTPGFTADQSLYLSNRHYRTGLFSAGDLPSSVIAQYKFPQGGGGDCHETCGACTKGCRKTCNNTCLPEPYDLPCCASTETCCEGDCVDTSSDSANCGACGYGCPNGQICNHGECRCPSGFTLCDGKCVDLKSDWHNCGACGHGCPNGQYCDNGKCDCNPGYTLCGGECIDTFDDPSNCGGCGIKCKDNLCCEGTCGGTHCNNAIGCCPKGKHCCTTHDGVVRCCSVCIPLPFGLGNLCL